MGKEEEVAKSVSIMQPPLSAVYNTPLTQPRNPFGAGVTYATLRQLSINYPIARACIDYLKSKITQLDWDITTLAEDRKSRQAAAMKSEEVKKFFKRFGDSGSSFRTFLTKSLDDLLILDALAIYELRNVKGDKVFKYFPVDAATIKLLINKDGTTPEPPDPAYVQVINGTEGEKLTTQELIYRMLYPRTYSPYGLSPLESLIVIATTALKSSHYNLGFLSDGNVPEGFVELPKEVANNKDQVAQWQQWFDALVGGDPKFQRKIKFMPAGMKYTPTKKPEDMSFEKFEQWLLQNTCAVFGVPPQDIGFTLQVNKSTSDTQFEIGKQRGMAPLANLLKEVFDEIIQERMGYEDLQFIWTNLNPVDRKEEADIQAVRIQHGLESIDEVREKEGKEPIGAGPMIWTPQGPIPVGMVEERAKPQPQVVPNDPNNPNPPADEEEETEEEAPVTEPQKGSFISEEELKEVRAYKRMALRDVKTGRPGKKGFRKFNAVALDPKVVKHIEWDLQLVKDEEGVRAIFDQYLAPGSQLLVGVKRLHDELADIISPAN